MWTDAFPGVAESVRSIVAEGAAMVLERRFRQKLPDEAIDAHLEHAAKAPSELSLMHLYPIDGAVHRVSRNDTAWSCRDATWSMVIAGIDPIRARQKQ